MVNILSKIDHHKILVIRVIATDINGGQLRGAILKGDISFKHGHTL